MKNENRYMGIGECGLLVDAFEMSTPLTAAPPVDWPVPPYIDFQPYCLEASDQGDNPSCVGETVAGYVEVYDWRKHDHYGQRDGLLIYKGAKERDGAPRVRGTYPRFAVQAAQEMGLIPKEFQTRQITDRLNLQYALHRYGICICGFNITRGWGYVDPETGAIDEEKNEQVGGHAVLVCYYDQEGIIWQNSWGNKWGKNGFGRMSWQAFDEQFMLGLVIERPV